MINLNQTNSSFLFGRLVPFVVFIFILLFVELVLRVFTGPPVTGVPSINSHNKTYWHYQPNTEFESEGTKYHFNSFGFRGSTLMNKQGVLDILLLGDSLPLAQHFALKDSFPKVAERIINSKNKSQTLIYNASIGAFSLPQIRMYYEEVLESLPHELIILSFYIDDINRELRYRKNGILYTPLWPETLQDLYYKFKISHIIMRQLGYSSTKFLYKRSKTYDQAWPNVFNELAIIKNLADKRGKKFAIFNIPRFNWKNSLSSVQDYEYLNKNKELEKWAAERSIAYFDTTPLFAQHDINKLRIAAHNVHFTKFGHQVMGEQLAYFIDHQLIASLKIVQ